MRLIVIGIIVLTVIGVAINAASMTGNANTLGSGSSTVPHCQVRKYSIAASDTISSVNADVRCDTTGSYNVTATVTSGAASGMGTTSASLTGGSTSTVSVAISPSVSISSSTYNVDVLIKK